MTLPKPPKPTRSSRPPRKDPPAAPPKRRNAPQTKARILAAAQQAFAEIGYAQAGIRDIAAIAGISSTLLPRYYGSKAGLFEAALVDAMRMDEVLGQGREGLGERLAAVFLDRNLDIKPPSMVTLSTGDSEAREIATRVMEEQVLKPLAKWLGPPDGRVRALEILLLSMGFVLFTRQFPLLPGRGADKLLAAWFAQTVQAIVDRT